MADAGEPVAGDEVVVGSDVNFRKRGEAKGGGPDKQGVEGRRYVVPAGREGGRESDLEMPHGSLAEFTIADFRRIEYIE